MRLSFQLKHNGRELREPVRMNLDGMVDLGNSGRRDAGYGCVASVNSHSLDKCEKLEQWRHLDGFAFPENARFHMVVSITAQLVEGLASTICLKRRSYLSQQSPWYCWAAWMIRLW